MAMIGWFLADIIYESQTFYQDRTWTYAVFATNWSFFLLVITCVYQTVCSLVYTIKSSNNLGNASVEKMDFFTNITRRVSSCFCLSVLQLNLKPTSNPYGNISWRTLTHPSPFPSSTTSTSKNHSVYFSSKFKHNSCPRPRPSISNSSSRHYH